VSKGLPAYVTQYHDRHGKLRTRYRRTGFKTYYFKCVVGSDGWWKEYLACQNGQSIVIDKDRAAPGTVNDLLGQYYGSVHWKNIPKDSTRRVYRLTYERFRARYGDETVNDLTALNLVRLMERMSDTPAAATNMLKRLKALLDYAIVLGWRTDNPARAVKPPRSKKKGGLHTWSEEEIAQFEAKHAVGSRERLALALMLYTAQRRSDIHTMGPQHIKDGRIKVRQMKTDALVQIPIHPELRRIIEATPTSNLAFIVSSRGAPYRAESFSNWFRKAAREAGLTECPAHGLRKAAARRMAEMGLSNQLIKSITGHTSDSEVARYTRDADQVVRADKAMSVWAGQSLATLETGLAIPTPNCAENKE
jgi:integrase